MRMFSPVNLSTSTVYLLECFVKLHICLDLSMYEVPVLKLSKDFYHQYFILYDID